MERGQAGVDGFGGENGGFRSEITCHRNWRVSCAVCHRNCLMRLLRKAIAAGNELSRARCGTRKCGELELQPIGRISLTGPCKARPDGRLRRKSATPHQCCDFLLL